EREELRDRGSDVDEEFKLDFPIKFARDLAAHVPPATKRADQVHAAHDFIEGVRRDELAKVATDLSKLGIDWADAPMTNGVVDPAQIAGWKEIEVKVETDRPNAEVNAGEPMALLVTVKNNGKNPIYRLHANTESDNPYFDSKELVFGKVAPG